MTRRLALDYSVTRSETIRTRLELLLEDPPRHGSNCPPTQPVSPVVVRVPRLPASNALDSTENDS